MALLLTIDTSGEAATIVLAEDAQVIGSATNDRQSDHASWLHSAIRDLFQRCEKDLPELKGVVVVAGPGSYTGLRVGMATAKGLCYALDKPLFTLNRLALYAAAYRNAPENQGQALLVCPMIDARRMEVFTGVYGQNGEILQAAAAVILEKQSFKEFLLEHTVVFLGNGVEKWRTLCDDKNAVYSDFIPSVTDLARESWLEFRKEEPANLAYSEPEYVKTVYVIPSGSREK